MSAPRRTRKLKATTPEAPRFDYGPEAEGAIDIWPILAAGAATLAEEIGRGDHDAYLALLTHCDRAQHDGGRTAVQEAAKRRRGL